MEEEDLSAEALLTSPPLHPYSFLEKSKRVPLFLRLGVRMLSFQAFFKGGGPFFSDQEENPSPQG